MNTRTRGRRSPQEQCNVAGQRRCNVHTQAQHGVVPGGRAAGEDRPFPNKPVHHRRTLNPKMHDSLELHDFEKITISGQPRGPLSSQEHHSNGIRETTGSHHPRKDSPRVPNRELQMSRAIHAKELILQEKLWRAEDKIRQMIQRDSGGAAAAASDDQKSEEERHDRGQVKSGKSLTKTRLREPAEGREMLKHERRPEDVKQLRKTQNQTNKESIRKTHEEQGARWGGRETEVVQFERKGNKGPHESTTHVHKVSGELNRRKGEVVKAEQNKTSTNCDIWTREQNYKERKKVYGSHDDDDDDEELDRHHKSQQKTVHRLEATENHRGAGSKISEESSLPPVSSPSHSNRAQQRELRLTDSTDAGLQLLPCRICNRKFSHERLEKHVQVCQKVKQSHRQVFNSYINRTKGSAIEEFWKTHSKTPEDLKKKNQRQTHKVNMRTLHQGRPPAGTSQSKWSK